jgi:hypothetical protein
MVDQRGNGDQAASVGVAAHRLKEIVGMLVRQKANIDGGFRFG